MAADQAGVQQRSEGANRRTAEQFREAADPDTQGANPFRASAYRCAAAVVSGLPEPIGDTLAREGVMKRSRAAAALAMTCLAWVPVGAQSQEAGLGATEYRVHCATCHGFSGTGTGPYAEMLAIETPDLTTLSKNNGGVFPSTRVRDVIEGRREVSPHGSSDMPIWGSEYDAEAADYYREVWKIENPEAMIRQRREELVDYIESLQKP